MFRDLVLQGQESGLRVLLARLAKGSEYLRQQLRGLPNLLLLDQLGLLFLGELFLLRYSPLSWRAIASCSWFCTSWSFAINC
jgi:hypothetical protein